jgi:hypothetical protein
MVLESSAQTGVEITAVVKAANNNFFIVVTLIDVV